MNPNILKYCFFSVVALSSSIILSSCVSLKSSSLQQPENYTLTRLFPTDTNPSVSFDESIIASPLLDYSQGKPMVLVSASNGIIAALNGDTGRLEWQINAPAPIGQSTQLISTPVIIENKLVILYQCLDKGVRTSHRLAVIDLALKQFDPTFPILILSAEKPAIDGINTVKFNPPTAFSHSALKHAPKPDSKLGYVYAAFGNSGDEQPYHGWLFEIDMDAWRFNNSQTKQQPHNRAISNVLLTTPESKCPVTKAYGNQEMICGGGIWTPAGPQIYPTDGEFEIFVPTGNGQINLGRHDYANTIMRLKPGLNFDAGCDTHLCVNFDPLNPDRACMASCKNLFIPRLLENDTLLKPATGECDNKSYGECLAWMDYDLGGSAPVKIQMENGLSVLVQPSKDGSVFLIDAKHIGTQYDRLQIVDICGTKTDECKLSWMGMIVTQPVHTTYNKETIVVIPTFVPDKTHPAGMVALKIVVENGRPQFKRFWQFPQVSSPDALQIFRSHPSLPTINTQSGNSNETVWIVDINQNGTIYGVRIRDGALVAKQTLKGAGRPLSTPLIFGDKIYIASIMPGTNKAMIEAYRIETHKN